MTEPNQPPPTTAPPTADEPKPADAPPKGEPVPAAELAAPPVDVAAAALAEPEPAVEPPIPGERLGAPPGSTRVIADYGRPRPSFVFLALVSIVSLAADVASKSWAERHLDGYPGTVEIWKNHLTLLLAKNRGGAWGLLQSTSENVRRPFFLLVSVAAIAFIMTLYRRLQPRQRSLKWGLPLVLGGALGNVFDRIRYGHVIDFIDAHVLYKGIEHHWPTFNIADVAICVGVGLMAVDMFASKRGPRVFLFAPHLPPAQSGEPSVGWNGGAVVADELPPQMDPLPAVEPAEVAPDPAGPAEPPAEVPPTE